MFHNTIVLFLLNFSLKNESQKIKSVNRYVLYEWVFTIKPLKLTSKYE